MLLVDPAGFALVGGGFALLWVGGLAHGLALACRGAMALGVGCALGLACLPWVGLWVLLEAPAGFALVGWGFALLWVGGLAHGLALAPISNL